MSQPVEPTSREQRKAQRRQLLLAEGARLIAERGFRGARLDDLGAAAGISGPAVYRHFPSKEALLVEVLTAISEQLFDNARAIAAECDGREALERLVDQHVDFALDRPDLIRIQERELENLPPAARHHIRKAQRQYVEIWVRTLRTVRPELGDGEARVTAHAVIGLINSTPYSAATTAAPTTGATLRRMALAALAA